MGFSGVIYAQKIDHNPNRDPIRTPGPERNYRLPPTTKNSIIVRDGNTSILQKLYILDGKVISEKEFTDINPNIIESINMLNPKNAIPLYGEKGKNGVIIIQTKKNIKQEKFKLKTEPILAL